MTPPRIARLEFFRLSLDKSVPAAISLGVIGDVRNVLLRLTLDNGMHGWGEACPYAVIVGETQEGIWAQAPELAALWLGRDAFAIAARVADLDAALTGNATLKSLFDLALHDAVARTLGLPLWRLFGGAGPRPIRTDMTVYLDASEVMAARAREHVAEGFDTIKVKVGRGFAEDVACVRAIRAAVGPDVTLRLDANQGWDFPTALRTLRALEPLGIAYCEQPLARLDFEGMRRLTAESPVPVMADESLFDHHDAAALASAPRACDFFNLKLAKTGGLQHARAVLAVAEAARIPVQLGCMGETRLALTPLVHLAYAHPFVSLYDLDGCVGHAVDPVCGGMRLERGGHVALEDPEAPGLGVEVEPEFLATLETRIRS